MLTPLDWYEVVLEEYGSLAQFGHTSSMRHALSSVKAELANLDELEAFNEVLTQEELADINREKAALLQLKEVLEQHVGDAP